MRAGMDNVIPDAWLGGFLQGHPEATVLDAVNWWINQVQLEQQWIAQQQALGVPQPLRYLDGQYEG